MVRKFDTGATRDSDDNKLDFEGFLSPLVLKRYGQYMHAHRKQSDGCMRDSDNWQKGIPPEQYLKSAFRHFFDLWSEHRGIATHDGVENEACALLFNVSGYLHEYLKAKTGGNKARLVYEEALTTAPGQDAKLDGVPSENAYLARFGPNANVDVSPTGHSSANVGRAGHNAHPMQAEADHIAEWARSNGTGL